MVCTKEEYINSHMYVFKWKWFAASLVLHSLNI